jgi:hypothetical protein
VPDAEKSPTSSSVKTIAMKRTLITAALILLIDAFVLNQGLIAVLALAWALVILLPMAIVSVFRDHSQARQRFFRAAIYVLAALAVFGANALNNMLARHRANQVIVALQEFKAVNGKYPDRLDQLVPKFLRKVPRPKYTLDSSNTFDYFSSSSAVLMYRVLPPFGRAIYRLEEKKWSYLD